MRNLFLRLAALVLFMSCGAPAAVKSPLNGTWRLVRSQSVVGKDTTDTSPLHGTETIKLYNDDHFAFFTHDLSKGRSASSTYDSGAGTFKLKGSGYTEQLAYCSERPWEGHTFSFTLQLSKDTFMQRGVERIDSLHINHVIIETYARVR